jgi:1-acyl-sn-glycerol-3-phosphate acyltransferase
MLDPILISLTNPIVHHYITRASAFKSPIADKILRSLNLIPIYRVRDGVNSMRQNEQIFKACSKIFTQTESVIMFPEGSDHLQRRVRPLKKGFSRIVFGHFDEFPDSEVMIVPVGINYNNMFQIGSSVSVHYGKAFSAKQYYDPNNLNASVDKIKERLSSDLKQLVTHVEDKTHYDSIIHQLKNKGVDFLDPVKANKLLSDQIMLENGDEKLKIKNVNLMSQFISFLFKLNTVFPIIIWRMLKHKVNSIKLIPTFKFGLSLGLIPIFYGMQASILGFLTTAKHGWFYLLGSILLLIIYKNTRRVQAF